jgi:hypothetical protein
MGDKSFVIYVHPDNDKIFAVGSPVDWQAEKMDLNPAATKILGQNVYGIVYFVAKNQLRIHKPEKKKQQDIPEKPAAEGEGKDEKDKTKSTTAVGGVPEQAKKRQRRTQTVSPKQEHVDAIKKT